MTNYVTELEKLNEAARLIEKTTGNRFKGDSRNSFLYSESDRFIGIHMNKYADSDGESYNVRFEAKLMESGKPLTPEHLLQLVFEGVAAYALMNKLAEMEYHPTTQDLYDFNEFILQREDEVQAEGFGMNQQM